MSNKVKTPEELAEHQYDEVRKYLIENTKPTYQADLDSVEFFAKAVWKLGDIQYTEYFQSIENEDGDLITLEDEEFNDYLSSEAELEELFTKFAASGRDDFETFFEEETGCKTWALDYGDNSDLSFNNRSQVVFMFSGEISESDFEDMNEIYNACLPYIEKKQLDERMAARGININKERDNDVGFAL